MKTTYLLAIVILAAILILTDPTIEDLSQEAMNRIERFAEAIKTFEGWKPGSRSYNNNNPGNLKGGVWPGVIGKDDAGFLIFQSFADGWNALVYQITLAAKGKSSVYSPQNSILQFFEKYAPSSDNNNPASYARFVANYIGLPVDTLIGTLVT